MKLLRLPITIVIIHILCTAFVFGTEIQNVNNNDKATQLKSIDSKVSGISALGSIYRNTRQTRCYRCYEEGRSRYSDDNRSYYNPSSRTSNYADDRSGTWYTRSYDRYDDRARYYDDRYPERNSERTPPPRSDYYSSGDRYSSNRYNDRYYDDHYYFRTSDRNDRVHPNRYDRYERDRYYPTRTYDRYERPREYEDRHDTYSRDRYYDRYDSRYPERDDRYPSSSSSGSGGYEGAYRATYRPYDDYRGQSAIDTNTGRGYWFADRPSDRYPYYDRPDGGPPPSPNGLHYLPNNGQPPPHPLQDGPNNNSTGQSGQDYEYKRPQQSPNQQQPSNKDGYAGGWNYSNDRDKNNNNNNNLGYNQNDRDKDIMSSSYGSRSRPLSGSYLLDRESNDPSKAVNQPNDNNSKKSDGPIDNGSSSRVENKNGQMKTENITKKTI